MPIDYSKNVLPCLELVWFRARQLHYAIADDQVGLKHAMPDMALSDLEIAIDELRSAFDEDTGGKSDS